jgi:chromosome segregation ATPase
MWTWLKVNGGGFIAIGALLTFLQFFVVTPLRNQSNQNFEALRREINQHIDAQGKRIDDLKAEMNARFDAQDKRFDAQDKYINQRFDAVDQRFDAQDRRIEDLAKDVSELRTLSERVSRNEGRIDAIMEQLQTADVPSP